MMDFGAAWSYAANTRGKIDYAKTCFYDWDRHFLQHGDDICRLHDRDQ